MMERQIFRKGVRLMRPMRKNTRQPIAPASAELQMPKKMPPMITTATIAMGIRFFRETSFSFQVKRCSTRGNREGLTMAAITVNREKPIASARPGAMAAMSRRPIESPDRAPKMTIRILGGINWPMLPEAAIKP